MPSTDSGVTRGKLAGWLVLVTLLAALGYGGRLSSGKPPANALYHYDLAAGTLVLELLVLSAVLLIARGVSREALGLRPPDSWWHAARLAAGLLVALLIVEQLLEAVLHAAREQGLEPTRWEPSHAGAFAVNAVVVVLVAPFVEELTYRGLGMAVLSIYGSVVAVVGTAVAFAAAHGLVEGFPALLLFGIAIAFLRLRTGSVYPGMLFHATFNAVALGASFLH
ncbi:MAG TPA: CPBP family intramembrane glutamic endopeptidase [Gaiellaceae bacterium]|nr:CPBP family intramembrane glutamic endopeptidase [Gaiellaceae bacterium]